MRLAASKFTVPPRGLAPHSRLLLGRPRFVAHIIVGLVAAAMVFGIVAMWPSEPLTSVDAVVVACTALLVLVAFGRPIARISGRHDEYMVLAVSLVVGLTGCSEPDPDRPTPLLVGPGPTVEEVTATFADAELCDDCGTEVHGPAGFYSVYTDWGFGEEAEAMKACAVMLDHYELRTLEILGEGSAILAEGDPHRQPRCEWFGPLDADST